MNKRVLLAWELGGGRGHAYIAGWIARALKQRGYQPILAVQQLNSLHSIEPDLAGIEYLQAPVWPGILQPESYWSPGPAITLGDVIAELGLRSPPAVVSMIRAWDRLLAMVKPAAVIADYAPGVLLAARGNIPTVAVGEGFTLPPSTMKTFPSLKADAAVPKNDESQLLEVVNACLRETSRPALSYLPEIFSADRSCVASFAEFDAYAAFRRQPNAGPWMPRWDHTVSKQEREIFAYFSIRANFQIVIVKALQEVAQNGIPVRIHMPQLSAEQQSALESVGIIVERTPLPFEDIQHRSRLVASLGSLSFLSCALVAGIPQIVFPLGTAKHIAGNAIDRLGVGRWLELNPQNPFEPALLAQALTEAYRDDKIAVRAKELAPDFARRLEPRPEEMVAGLVEELVGPA